MMCMTVVVLSGCKDKNRLVEPHDGPAHVMMKVSEHNFGKLDGSLSVVECEFQLINDGNEVLTINDAENLCHCTHLEFPKEPIRPGHGCMLKAYLNVLDLSPGYFTRTIILHTNAGDYNIFLKGERL